MLKDIVGVEPRDNYSVFVRFEDGLEGIIELRPHLSFQGVFAPLRDPSYFRQVRVDPELGTIVWPNGADLDPDVLYSQLSGIPIQLHATQR
jgi:hypothetical protein